MISICLELCLEFIGLVESGEFYVLSIGGMSSSSTSSEQQEDLNPTSSKITVFNVSGSTAGSSSGDFHIYRTQRRKEIDRLETMEKESQLDQENREFLTRREETKKVEEQKVKRKAEQRKKKKQNRTHAQIRKKLNEQLEATTITTTTTKNNENDDDDEDEKENKKDD
ncbi:hypothetical protein DFA_05981 [Cavenderia fasciculata]|uniref:DUF1168 family protein n=1 Tax=Cavenderia fasciculata TaxID=261658 RepID=F4PJS1_CACFS|nr:uncharacterized protein DFA_05981 [Cavenderia fasciculata]EGG23845.1 hypothetical protein DFA_05981 [Cavenderia fasciculata]|eukprot:XP_004361696.1 hypothetical protein DFA_05981 [Cavenderia fasciculata]